MKRLLFLLILALGIGLIVSLSFKNKMMKVIDENLTIQDSHLIFKNNNTTKKVKLIETKPGKQWSDVIVSKNNKYVAVNNIKDYSEKTEFVNKGNIEIYSKDGKKLWELKDSNMTDIKISPTGKFILGTIDSAYGNADIQFFHKDGFSGVIKKDSRCWNVAFNENKFALFKKHFDSEKKELALDLIVYDEHLHKLWEKKNIAFGLSCGYDITFKNNIINLHHYKNGDMQFKIGGEK